VDATSAASALAPCAAVAYALAAVVETVPRPKLLRAVPALARSDKLLDFNAALDNVPEASDALLAAAVAEFADAVAELAEAVAELAEAVAVSLTPEAELAAAVAEELASLALVVAVLADVLALEALAAESLAFVVAMTACAVTADKVESVLESPAPPSPLNIAMNSPHRNKQKKRKEGLRRIPPVCYLCLAVNSYNKTSFWT